MKKHLVAFLSMIGLAGAAAPVQAQVLKGSSQESKTESQIKQAKQKQEKSAVQKVREFKSAKDTAAANAVKSEASLKRGITTNAAKKNDTTAQAQIKPTDKLAKASAAQKTVQNDLQKKTVKSKNGVRVKTANPN